MTWNYKYIDDPSAAYAESTRYLSAMTAVLLLPVAQDAAIYSRADDVTGGMHYYFTPAASNVASKFGACPCSKPSRSEIGGLLVGDQTLINRLY